MSLEECKGKAAEERQADGVVNGKRVSVSLVRNFGSFKRWKVRVYAYRQTSTEDFYRRSSADSLFEELVLKYGLEEAED